MVLTCILFLQRYLKFEESAGDPARVQILYERAITEFPISSDLWTDYARYIEKKLKVLSQFLILTVLVEKSAS